MRKIQQTAAIVFTRLAAWHEARRVAAARRRALLTLLAMDARQLERMGIDPCNLTDALVSPPSPRLHPLPLGGGGSDFLGLALAKS